MEGFKNVLLFLYNNWVTILVCCGLIAGIVKKTIKFMSQTEDAKVAAVKSQIKQVALKMVTDAEKDFDGWNKAGSIKRSQVVKQIYDSYPILATIADQDEVIKFIDEEINNALKTLKDVICSASED